MFKSKAKKNEVTLTQDGFYIINCTEFLMPNSTFTAVVNVLNTKATCKMVLDLQGPNLDVEKQTVDIEPMTSKTVTFQIPNITSKGTYKFVVDGTEGLIFNDSVVLGYRDATPSVFVQTDRATYKPGDMVQFRVLVLDEYLRPAETLDKPIGIYVNDTEKNRIKQYKVEALTNGVYSEKLQLSEYTNLGDWSIIVNIDGKDLCTKTFQVDKYILPSFEVIVEAPKKVSVTQDKVSITVMAKYTYGQFVEGKATITVKPKEPNYRPMFGCRPIGFDETDPAKDKNSIQKIVPIKGKTIVDFEMASVLLMDIPSYSMDLDVDVAIIDDLTGKEQSGKTSTLLVQKSFNLEVPNISEKLEESYDRKKKFPFTIAVTNLNDEPVHDTTNPIRVTMENNNVIYFGPVEVFTNELGKVTVELPIIKPGNYYNVRAEYRQCIECGSFQTYIPHKEDHIGLRVETAKPSIGKAIDLELKWKDSIGVFVYTVVSHGRILKSEVLNVDDVSAKFLKLSLDSTFEMMPHAKVYAQYIKGKEIHSYETRFDIEREFLNKIALTAPEEAEPGDEIALNVKTDTDSFVGLLAVDQSVLLLKSGNDLDANDIWNNIGNSGHGRAPYHMHHSQDNALVTLTNANFPMRNDFNMLRSARGAMPALFGGAAKVRALQAAPMADYPEAVAYACADSAVVPLEPPRVRKQFLETWFFDDLHASSDNLELKKILPDTITSWVVTGFAVHPRTGFALTKEATKIKTFRPFFIVTNLPYSIKRGEVVSIPIIVFNYSDEPVTTEVVLEANDEEFEAKGDLTSSLNIPAGGGETVNFIIRPKRVGHVTLKVSACSQRFSDAIEKELKVEPEGVTVYQNHDIFFDTKSDNSNESSLQKTLKLAIPDVIVPESEHIEVSVMGDILGSTITNLDKLVRMPCGCGEQNMVNFVPNILVLDYLISTNHLTKGIEESAKRHLNIGYQRELTYKHDDGSYSAFGKSDNSGSTWLTAYVVRSFLQASKYIDIDAKIVAEGVKFLHSKQEGNGSFREHGKLFDFTHLDEFGLTAFVLLALIDQQNSSEGDKDWSIVDKGLEYLKQNIDKCESSHAVSMAVYALNLRKPGSTEFLKKLDICLKSEGGHKWWTSFPKDDPKEVETKTECRRPWICVKPKNYDIEITSYALMSMLAANTDTAQSLPTIKWLISKRNSNGGFSTTQDTVVGLQALIQFAMKIKNSIGEFEISISDASSGVPCGNLQITPNNSLIVQTLELPREVREIKYDVKGDGSGLLQIAYRYNIADKTEGPAFELSVTSKLESVGLLKLSSMVKYLLNVPSNMVVMELSLPSGFKAMVEKFESIQSGGNVKRVETQNEDTKVIIYFESLTEGFNHTLDVYATRSHIVSEQKPSPVKLYDYYDQEKQATSFYEIQS